MHLKNNIIFKSNTSAKITLLLAVRVNPVEAAVIDNKATLTSGYS